MESLRQDLRLALRQLLANKVFSSVAILTLALGIGATATLCTVVNAVLLTALPYGNPNRLAMLKGSFKGQGGDVTFAISQTDFDDWRKRCTAFADMSVWGDMAFNLEQGAQSQHLTAELVNASFFRVLGLKPALGRFFTAEEDAHPLERYVVFLGYDLWRRTFGGDPAVLGRKLQFNGRLYEVVGVAPPGFRGMSDAADVWIPSMLPPVRSWLTARGVRWASGVARLAPGVTEQQAQQQLGSVTAGLAQEFPGTNRGLGARVTLLKEFWFGRLRRGLLVVTLGAWMLLLIACINVATLLLTRATAKQRAFVIRIALGASRLRLLRQLITDGMLLSLLGAGCGLLLSAWSTRVLIAVSRTQLPSFVHLTQTWGVIMAILGLAALCGVAFGLAPIWLSYRAELIPGLGRDEQPTARGRGWQRFQSIVVVAQVALALTLSITALLMAKGFYKMIGEDLGFRPDSLLSFRIDPRGGRYLDDALVARMLRQDYLPRLAAVPGVQRLAIANPTIPTDDLNGGNITVEDHSSDTADGSYLALLHAVSPDYFAALGIPIARGRGFTTQDVASNVAIVSREMADRQWPGQEPLGKRLKLGLRNDPANPWLSVVGVAGNVRYEGFEAERAAAPDVYLSVLQFVRRPPLTINFVVQPRQGVSGAQLQAALHREMSAVNVELPEYDYATLQERLAKQTGKTRFQVVLISLFTVLALVMVAIGLYGVNAYSVAQRRREIAIRISLGADRRRILRMVVGHGALLALIGLAAGLVAVLSLSRLLAHLLYQTPVADPLILGGSCLGILFVSLAANYLPARHAAAVDPATGLRLQ
jgi:predicted permease